MNERMDPIGSLPRGPFTDRENQLMELADGESTSAFVLACELSGLSSILEKASDVTVFAPVDRAFRRLPRQVRSSWTRPSGRDELARLVASHVVPGRLDMGAFAVGKVRTLSGRQLTFLRTQDELWLGAGQVVEGPIRAGTCLLYLVDELVVLPEGSR